MNLYFLQLICENVKEKEANTLNGCIPQILENLQNHQEEISTYKIVEILKSNRFLKLSQVAKFFKILLEKKSEKVQYLEKEIEYVKRTNEEDLSQVNILKTKEFTVEVGHYSFQHITLIFGIQFTILSMLLI